MKRLEKENIDSLRRQEAELREYQLRMHEERNEARTRAADLEAAKLDLTASLERVRCTSKNGPLTRVAALQSKVRELGSRRTLNQRRVSDANLADRRTRVAEEKAAAATAALREYGTTAESERAATERAESLEEELFEVQTVEVQWTCSKYSINSTSHSFHRR